jgi:pectate lyase
VVTATSVADPSKAGSATVSVTEAATTGTPAPTPPAGAPVTSVTVSPKSATATTDGTLQFTATVQGTTTDKTVAWSAALGKINNSGLYTAPGNPGNDTITATSDADSTKSATVTVSVSAPVTSGGPLPSFPGAQGSGAASVGGRGGVVIEVTNTNDSGAGSLRNCLEATGPRTCIFRVAGLFSTNSEIIVNSPFLTVAGESAPGQVLLGGPNTQDVLRISTHDTVVRYVTFSPDNYNVLSGPDTGTVGYSIINTQNYNNIVDHVSSRWAGNKEIAVYAGFSGEYNKDFTWQWSMVYEPHAGHPVGPSVSENDIVTITQASPDVDFHHNLFVNIDHRIPEYNNPTLRWVNNITYNYSWYGLEGLGATSTDVINNVWDYANLVPAQQYPIHSSDGNWPGSLPGTPSFYVTGNIGHGRTTPNADQIGELTYQITGENGDEVNGHFPSSWQRSQPLPASNAFPIVADPAANLGNILLPTIGNSQHLDCSGNWVSHRDPEDTRIINQYKNHGDGGFWPNGVTAAITNQSSPSQIPTPSTNWQDHPQTGFSVCQESMHDGIPDQWKASKGLSTSDPNLYRTTAPNGYTWLENYLNGQ